MSSIVLNYPTIELSIRPIYAWLGQSEHRDEARTGNGADPHYRLTSPHLSHRLTAPASHARHARAPFARVLSPLPWPLGEKILVSLPSASALVLRGQVAENYVTARS